jgi:hypothetical protein
MAKQSVPNYPVSDLAKDFVDAFPRPAGNARAMLAHAVAVFNSNIGGPRRSDDDIVVTTSYNVYGPGVATGLTVGHLRDLARQLGIDV